MSISDKQQHAEYPNLFLLYTYITILSIGKIVALNMAYFLGKRGWVGIWLFVIKSIMVLEV